MKRKWSGLGLETEPNRLLGGSGHWEGLSLVYRISRVELDSQSLKTYREQAVEAAPVSLDTCGEDVR